MAVQNPSFENAGARPGEAEHWILVAVASVERIAGFGPGPVGVAELAWEGFEDWFARAAALEDLTVVRAFFDLAPEGFEDFNENRENDLYLLDLQPAQQAAASFGPVETEDYEGSWANDGYAWSWDDLTSVVGVFDGEPLEDFEEQWSGNHAFAWTWGAVTSVAARFDAGAQDREDFEDGWTAATTI